MENKNLAPHEPVVREGGPTPSNATAETTAGFVRAWNRAWAAWSTDSCTDIIATMKLGEAMMYAATDLISHMEDRIERLEVRAAAAPVYPLRETYRSDDEHRPVSRPISTGADQ